MEGGDYSLRVGKGGRKRQGGGEQREEEKGERKEEGGRGNKEHIKVLVG